MGVVAPEHAGSIREAAETLGPLVESQLGSVCRLDRLGSL